MFISWLADVHIQLQKKLFNPDIHTHKPDLEFLDLFAEVLVARSKWSSLASLLSHQHWNGTGEDKDWEHVPKRPDPFPFKEMGLKERGHIQSPLSETEHYPTVSL